MLVDPVVGLITEMTPLFYFYSLIGPSAALKPWFLLAPRQVGTPFFSLKHVDQVTCIASSESAGLSHSLVLNYTPSSIEEHPYRTHFSITRASLDILDADK